MAARDGRLSAAEARWLAIGAQGLGRPRPTTAVTAARLLRVFESLVAVQLDAINVLERTQFLVPFSRLGPYDVSLVHRLTGPGGPLWEYWGHAASLLPVDTQPMLRWRMAHGGTYVPGPTVQARIDAWCEAHADYMAAVLAEVRERGPLTAGELSDPRRRDGEWWGRRSVGRQALERLFGTGRLAAWRTPNFERVYDLPERVLPAEVLARPTPSVEDAHRSLLLLAARALGVATANDLAGYFMIQPRAARPRIAELVEDGALVAAGVDGWDEPAYLPSGLRPRRPTRTGAVFLSPFDSLIWDRRRTARLFGVDYTIEVYVPAPKRRYGYYVLPVLLGDEVVARLDLKADRRAGVLLVIGAFAEGGREVPPGAAAGAIAAELVVMAEWLGLEAVRVSRRGDLAQALRRTVASA